MAEPSAVDLADRDGQSLTVRGVARTGAAGALVLLAGGSPAYIDGLRRWPPELEGAEVEVTGTVRARPAQVGPGEPPAHGLASATVVLDSAEWTPVLSRPGDT